MAGFSAAGQTKRQYTTYTREDLAPCPLLRGPDSWGRASEEGQQLLIFQDGELKEGSPGRPHGRKDTTAAHLSGQENEHLGQGTLLV